MDNEQKTFGPLYYKGKRHYPVREPDFSGSAQHCLECSLSELCDKMAPEAMPCLLVTDEMFYHFREEDQETDNDTNNIQE